MKLTLMRSTLSSLADSVPGHAAPPKQAADA
jgi:hypothetical protein